MLQDGRDDTCLNKSEVTIILNDSSLNIKHLSIGAGMIFRLGEQKLNDFSVRGVKIGEKQSRQSNSKYKFMQYVFFKKEGV